MNKPRHRFQGTIINFIKDYQKKSKEGMKTHLNAIEDNEHKEDKCLGYAKKNKNIRMI